MLIVENGTIVVGADSFQSLVDARVDADNRGLTLDPDDIKAEADLRSAYYNLVSGYESSLQGYRVSIEQTGIFPRDSVTAYSFDVPNNKIPDDIKRAQVNIAASINDGADMNAIKTDADLASFNVDGVYSESYQSGSKAPTIPEMPAVSAMLKPYTNSALHGNQFTRDNYCGTRRFI